MDEDELMRIATVAARQYARRVWWASFEDMRSEALVAVVQAKKTWDVGRGIPFGAYAYRAALLAIRPYLWKNSSPVSESWHRLSTLRGVHRSPLLDAREVPDPRWPDEPPDDSEWLARVQDRLLELDPTKGLVVPVVLGTSKAEEVAEKNGLPISEVRRAAGRLRHLVRNDYPLWKLHWKVPRYET